MRIAAIYDVHGNLPALEAVLNEVKSEGVDCVVVGGDVLPGPQPRESLAALSKLSLPTEFISGNGEREVLTSLAGEDMASVPNQFHEAMIWVGRQLEPQQIQWLKTWPATTRKCVPGLGDVLFCHATPRSDSEIFTRLTPADRLWPALEDTHASIVVCGHTHMQFDREIGAVRVVNAGSVGMPFGEPGAYWLLIGPDVELRRTEYDLSDAARRIRSAGYPKVDGFVNRYLLEPPTEAEMLEIFERAAISS